MLTEEQALTELRQINQELGLPEGLWYANDSGTSGSRTSSIRRGTGIHPRIILRIC